MKLFFQSIWSILKSAKVRPFKTTDKELDAMAKPPSMIPDGGFDAGKGDGRSYQGLRVDISLPGGEGGKVDK